VPVTRSFPSQLYHQRSMLDGYLAEDEAVVRQVQIGALVDRTVRVLMLFWGLWMMNRKLMSYQERSWEGIDKEMT
jgi:hypothetical protein